MYDLEMHWMKSTEKGMVMFTWGFDYADWSINSGTQSCGMSVTSVDVTPGKFYTWY